MFLFCFFLFCWLIYDFFYGFFRFFLRLAVVCRVVLRARLIDRRGSLCIALSHRQSGQYGQPCRQRQRCFSVLVHAFALLGRLMSDMN